MVNKNHVSVDDMCKELNISRYTLKNWYYWENKLLKAGDIKRRYLPEPQRALNVKGRPRFWNEDDIMALKEYQSTIINGRNGVYGKFSNPYYSQNKKCKKEETK